MPKLIVVMGAVAGAAVGTSAALAQTSGAPAMTFFVTSTGRGNGADLGGLEGADRHCQTLAAVAGAGSRTWRAYLARPEGRPPSTPATASARARGSTSAATSSPATSRNCTARTS